MLTSRTVSFATFIAGVALAALALAPTAAAVEPYRAYPASACLSGMPGPSTSSGRATGTEVHLSCA